MDTLIKLNNVSKKFRTERVETTAVNAASIEIKAGDLLSITGSSGSGKSSLLALMGLLNKPCEGQVLIDGCDISTLSNSQLAMLRASHIGYVFQSFNLIDDLTVYDNVAMPLKYQPKGSSGMSVEEAIELVGLSHRAQHYPCELSGGQQQRVAIARAVVGSSNIILADEPTGNLDSKSSEMIMDLLLKLNNEGKAICLVTHDPALAKLADRQLTMTDGVLSEVVE
ncbi:ABC transporter ATP-binding protein [Pseudoalteromonas sp. CO325X]|uniref:ABC transporter ATP-binding protein n=1 Tax=Pseudoalteromonas sp. CO325X TaxID=1777262 RepID=UPI001022D175|nr:ABC transporter ATP-binding protein [Pseudoalteromonas sp. CO325X]RZF83276.1 ABC transporter ATP-binding protein [Pseudoalteromonas sp. CO325X]